MPLYRSDDELDAMKAQLTTIGGQVAEILAIVTPLSLRPYVPTVINPVEFYQDNNLSGLNDGVQDITAAVDVQRGAKGMMAGTFPCQIRLSFSAPTVIRKLRFLVGQFNGPYNLPTGFNLYLGDGTDQLIYSSSYHFTSTDYSYFKEFSIPNKLASSVYRLDILDGGSVYELQVLGF